MSPVMLAKTCAQTSVYFKNAFEACQINRKLREFNGGVFCQILEYHSQFYMACAWMYLSIIQCALYKDKAKGCGLAVTLTKVMVAKFDQAKPMAEKLGGVYKTTFDKIYLPAVAMRD